jgi:hypothetical protein
MADDKTKRGKPDRSRININDYEKTYWKEELGVSGQQLAAAARKDRWSRT